MRVGFIGLGNMGMPMARNVLQAGFDLSVFNRTAAKAEDLVRQGAKSSGSPAQLGAECDVVLLCLPDDAAVRAVVAGANGLLQGMAAGAIVCDHSTVAPSTTADLRERAEHHDVGYLDAPVSGGPPGAAAGTLTIMVGGDAATLASVRPVLDVVGRVIFHCGRSGAGNTVKLVNNLIGVINLLAALEGLVLGVKAGIDSKVLHEVLVASTARSFALEKIIPARVYKREFKAGGGFSVDLMLKDIRLALAVADSEGVRTLLGSIAQQVYLEARAAGLGDKDVSSVVQPLERLAGVELSTRDG